MKIERHSGRREEIYEDRKILRKKREEWDSSEGTEIDGDIE